MVDYNMSWETELDRFKDAGQLVDWQRRHSKETPMTVVDAEIAGTTYASFHIRALPLSKTQAEWVWNLVHPFYGALMQHVHCGTPLNASQQQMFRMEYPNGSALYFPVKRASFVWDQLGVGVLPMGTRVKLLSTFNIDTVSRQHHFETLWSATPPEYTKTFPNVRVITLNGSKRKVSIIHTHSEEGDTVEGSYSMGEEFKALPYHDGGSWAKLTELVWHDTGCVII